MLSDEQIWQLASQEGDTHDDSFIFNRDGRWSVLSFARAIESALSQSTEQGERLNDALEEFDHRLSSWAKAYPLSVFPKPDLIRVNEVLKAAGLSLDSVSAECMRHVATKLDELFQPVRAAMSPHGDGGRG